MSANDNNKKMPSMQIVNVQVNQSLKQLQSKYI